jgi:hypothetical protein
MYIITDVAFFVSYPAIKMQQHARFLQYAYTMVTEISPLASVLFCSMKHTRTSGFTGAVIENSILCPTLFG